MKIKTTKGWVLVNDDEINDGDWFVCISAKGWIPDIHQCGGANSLGYRIAHSTNCYTPTKNDYRKIIMTDTTFSIENIPQMNLS